MSDLKQPLHLDSEGFWPGDGTYVPTSEWSARCAAGVLHDPEGESVICLCGFDEKKWPQGLETRDSTQVGHLPRVEWLPADGSWPGDTSVATEHLPEQVDGMGLDLTTHDPLGVGGLPAVSMAHGVSVALDPDAAVRVDDAGEVGEDERVHIIDSPSGGDVTPPFYSDPWLTVYHGDALTVLRTLPDESVHMVCTSPPFWGLRDYGTATWVGGDEGCDHTSVRRPGADDKSFTNGGTSRDKPTNLCRLCGATRQDSQLGLEPTPEEYVANLVAVFREARRVLRKDGTVWLNLGDSYSLNQRAGAPKTGSYAPERPGWPDTLHERTVAPGLKPKDLVGIPWRVAFALQADGWYLRSDIIWAKPNPMPESVTDRPTKSHEYIFLLSKSPRYYFDQEAVREPSDYPELAGRPQRISYHDESAMRNDGDRVVIRTAGRNIRSVWTMATQPYPGAHFATFPESLPERCIKAGTSEKGVCPECGAPWERVVEREGVPRGVFASSTSRRPPDGVNDARTANSGMSNGVPIAITTGWAPPNCGHRDKYTGLHDEPVPATVLDPFAGSGTTGMVAQSLSRRAVLIDLSLDYLGQLMARNREIPLGLTS